MPIVTSAATEQQNGTSQQLQNLLEQLERLRSQLPSTTTETTPTNGTTPILTKNFGIGNTDATTNGEISKWQTFLVNANKGLKALALKVVFTQGVPKGYFGPLTGEATVEWQTTMGISGTFPGVGPRTRAKMAGTGNTQGQIRVVWPNGGEKLRIGETTQIQWTSKAAIPQGYHLMTYLIDGPTQGHIAYSTSPSRPYDWRIESVAQGDILIRLEPGTYKLRMELYDDGYFCPGECPPPAPQEKIAKKIAEDESDAPFTIVAADALPLISNINPTSGLIGTPVTITGRGFSADNRILFTPPVLGCGTSILAPSINNTTLTFTIPNQSDPCTPGAPMLPGGVPQRTTAGTYRIQVFSATGSSNSMNFTVRTSLSPPPPSTTY